MRVYSLIIILFVFSCTLYSQVKVKIFNINQTRAELLALQGEKSTFIDSLYSSNASELKFNLDEKSTGFYRILFDKNKHLDFIFENEEIEIETDVNYIPDSLKIIKSESNKLYYEFLKLNKDYKTKTELLSLILARYPEEDDYYRITKEKVIQIQEEYLYFINVTAQKNPHSFIARYVRSTQLPVIDINIPPEEQLSYLKTHALDDVNFYDDGLIHSDAFASKTIEYLTYYRNPQLPLELLEKEFMKAIDSILIKAKVNEIVYTHIVEYLLDGFKKFGFDNVINYIVENYVIKDDICIDEKLETALERRIQQTRNFKVGNKVPNIMLPEPSDSLVDLSEINPDRTLIVFYASWCPHCQTLLPKIYDLYKDQKEKKLEVVAISIDTSQANWINFIKTNDLNWVNLSDLNGWNGQAVKDYFIYATPTMFLVDKNKELIAMPRTLEDIVKYNN